MPDRFPILWRYPVRMRQSDHALLLRKAVTSGNLSSWQRDLHSPIAVFRSNDRIGDCTRGMARPLYYLGSRTAK
jgi:hypothetical protein